MTITNKTIYPFKITFETPPKWDKLNKEFSEKNRFNNFIALDDKKYSASLSFIEEDKDFMFFSLSKCKNDNITISDFEKKEDKPDYLDEHKKVKHHSLFALIKKNNVLLALYDHDGFGYITPTLTLYFENKVKTKISECKTLARDFKKNEKEELLEKVKHIILKKARPEYVKYEENVEGSSKKKIKGYTLMHEDIIKIQRVSKMSKEKLFSIFKPLFDKGGYESIIIDGKNIGKIDILDKFYLKFSCDVSVNKSGLSEFESFKKEIKRVYAEEEKRLLSF